MSKQQANIFKVGPEHVRTLRQGVAYNLGLFVKSVGLLLVGLAAICVLFNVTQLINGKTPLPPREYVVSPMTLIIVSISLVFFAVRTYLRAQAHAHEYFSLEDDGIAFYRDKDGAKPVRKVHYKAITALIVNRGYLFEPGFLPNAESFWVWLHFRNSSSSIGMDSLMCLGPKGKQMLTKLESVLLSHREDLKVINHVKR